MGEVEQTNSDIRLHDHFHSGSDFESQTIPPCHLDYMSFFLKVNM